MTIDLGKSLRAVLESPPAPEGSESHEDVVQLLLAAEAAGLTKPREVTGFSLPTYPTKATPLDVSKIDGVPDQACSLFALLTLG